MYRGTTPTNTFKTSQDLSEAEVIFITYAQKGVTVFEKTKSDITFGTEDELHTMTVTLTQTDTLAFSKYSKHVNIQIRAKYSDDTAVASQIITAPVKEVLKDGII